MRTARDGAPDFPEAHDDRRRVPPLRHDALRPRGGDHPFRHRHRHRDGPDPAHHLTGPAADHLGLLLFAARRLPRRRLPQVPLGPPGPGDLALDRGLDHGRAGARHLPLLRHPRAEDHDGGLVLLGALLAHRRRHDPLPALHRGRAPQRRHDPRQRLRGLRLLPDGRGFHARRALGQPVHLERAGRGPCPGDRIDHRHPVPRRGRPADRLHHLRRRARPARRWRILHGARAEAARPHPRRPGQGGHRRLVALRLAPRRSRPAPPPAAR